MSSAFYGKVHSNKKHCSFDEGEMCYRITLASTIHSILNLFNDFVQLFYPGPKIFELHVWPL